MHQAAQHTRTYLCLEDLDFDFDFFLDLRERDLDLERLDFFFLALVGELDLLLVLFLLEGDFLQFIACKNCT